MREWWDSGCAGAFTVRTWLFGLPAAIGFGAIFTASRSQAPVLDGLLFVLSGYVVAGALVLAIRSFITSRQAPARSWLTLALFAIVGAITATVARGASTAAGFPPQGAPPPALVVIAAVCALWLTAAAMISFWIDADADMRRRLLRELARERALAIDSSRYLDEDRRQLTQAIEATVRSRLTSVGDGDTRESRNYAPELESVIATVIRPLSHQLHDERVEEGALVQQMQDLQIPRARRLREYVTSTRSLHRSDLLVIFGLLITAITASISAFLANTQVTIVATASIATVLGALALGWALVGSRSRAETVRADLTVALERAEWASARLRQSAWVARRQLANSLHGNVQARVLSSALRMRDEPDIDASIELRELSAELASMLHGTEAEADWHLAWERLNHIWSFSIEMEASLPLDVARALDADPVAGQSLVAVAGEAVTNAVRHGDARTIHLVVEQISQDELLLTVNDDGPIEGTSGDPGLGTAVFEAACIDWQVTTTENGHRLEARLPISAAREKTEAELVP